MKIYRSLAEIPAGFGPSVVAIGNFDGMHCGHRAVLADVCARAHALHAQPIVVTFDPHPLRFLRPADAPALITPLPQRLQLLAGTGVAATLVLPFTQALSQLSAEAFAQTVLQQALRAVAVHEGDNFRFGYRAQAGIEQLRELGRTLGFSVTGHPVLRIGSRLGKHAEPVSSSHIRMLIAAGSVGRARTLLGRPFSIQSTPASGRGIGTRLLVPTINLAPYTELKPAHGVYVTRLTIHEAGHEVGQKVGSARTFQAITNAGNRPTFGEDSYAIESHLLDFDPQAAPYLTADTPLELTFLHRLRGEQRFPSPEALKAQIFRDIARAKRYHHFADLLQNTAHRGLLG